MSIDRSFIICVGAVIEVEDLKNALALTQDKLTFYQEILEQPFSNMTYLEEWHLFKSKGEKTE